MKLFFVLLLFLVPSISFPADYSLQLNQVRLSDLSQIVYGDILEQSFLLDVDVIASDEVVSLNWINLSKSQTHQMMRDLLKLRGYELEQHGSITLIRKRNTQDEDLLIYQPRFRSSKYLSDVLSQVVNEYQMGTRGMSPSPGMQQAIASTPEVIGAASSQFDRSAPDQIAYRCMADNCSRIKRLLIDLDTPEAQVVLRAALYEVGTNKGEGSAVQIVAGLLRGQLSATIGSTLTDADQIRINSGGLDAILSVLDRDSRFKVVSRPMLRVRSGSNAKFSVGQQVPVLGSVSQDKNGNAVQSVDYRQSGTIFTVQPDIRLDVVDLNITQELSSFVQTTSGVNNSPTLLQRTAQSQLSIRPGEVVVFAGLEENREDAVRSSFFDFTTSKKESNTSSEVLLFIEAQPI